ncbi:MULTISPECIES: DUF3006 domain-containing protein [Bacillus]|uniref:DUF3006 domain-containing protein n=1 Tax=Bacillus TaxID=1386 RepID=UPI000310609F|nr:MULTISPECIES: DUF3006 domain-containing protein [Bacillus]
MKGIVDRFEGKFVVIEINGVTEDILKDLVADNVYEGDVVELIDNKWVKNELATEERRKSIKSLMNQLWEDG